MTAARILGLGTYPIQTPMHGGQRRVGAFKRFYERQGITYAYASVYNAAHYRHPNVGPYDCILDTSKCELWLTALIGDVMSGRQAATDQNTFRHFAKLVEQIAPDILQLEQPFMWPLARRLREMSGSRKPLVVYSSQNIEAPLKRTVLRAYGVQFELQSKICREIDEMEAELARDADLIICVSQADGDYYRHSLKSSSPIIVVPNGVDRPPKCSIHSVPERLSAFEGRPYLMTVSSAHVPSIEGICHYLINDGIFCVPPITSIAICGGIAAPISKHPEYQRYLTANAKRVLFFFDSPDSELFAVKRDCHGVFLPIHHGGGTNLKTAEALALGKWVVATSTALRGFERFSGAEGVIVTDTPADFRQAIRQVLLRPALVISEPSRIARDTLYWDRCFADSDLPQFLSVLNGVDMPRPHASCGGTEIAGHVS